MKTDVGLWIDYRKAVIVICMHQSNQIRRISSHVETLVSDADVPQVSQQDRQDLRLDACLTKFYGKVVGVIRHADSIVMFGPDEAKNELRKKLEYQGLDARIVAVETTNSMTTGQLVAKVREHIGKRKPEHENQSTD